MNIRDRFLELRKRKEAALIGFITTGDPDPETTVEIASALIRGGIDVLELGLPFSDPIADGPVIQKAGERALSAGMNTDVYFETAKKITSVPKACMTYYNLVLQRGLEDFTKECKESGVEGLIIPDLPIEEADDLLIACKKNDVSLIFFAAPTTTEERLAEAIKASTSFLYVVSVTGVTGDRKELSSEVRPMLARIKKRSGDIPLALGFGISKPEHVKEAVNAGADGVIVGSAFIKLIEKEGKDKEKMLSSLEEFAGELKKAAK